MRSGEKINQKNAALKIKTLSKTIIINNKDIAHVRMKTKLIITNEAKRSR